MKHVTSISYKLEPTIWSCDTGQWIAWFYRCQLIITWCHTSKKYTVNQGSMSLSTYYLDYGRHVAWLYHRRSHRAYTPTRNTTGPDNMRKSIHGFPLFPYIGMGLRLAARRAAGAPLLICWPKSETDFLVIKASSPLWLDFFLLNVFSPQGASFVILKAAASRLWGIRNNEFCCWKQISSKSFPLCYENWKCWNWHKLQLIMFCDNQENVEARALYTRGFHLLLFMEQD